MKRKPAAIEQFRCDYAIELVHGCCHDCLSVFAFDGSELIYADPPYLQSTRKAPGR